jgi:integrase
MAKREALHRTARLTEEGVLKLKPPTDRQYETRYDAGMPGLVLRVNKGGAKVWHALFYRPSVNKKTGKRISVPSTRRLGRYPILGVKEARVKARQFLDNPQKAKTQTAATDTFKEVATLFIERHVNSSKLRSKPEIERCLNKYILPHWKDLPFIELDRGDVTKLLDKIEDDHGPRQADMVLAIISKMMNWHASRSTDYTTKIVRGMRRTTGNGKRTRFLDDNEIRAVWGTTDDMGTFGALVRVLLLTGQRRDKVANMQWSDVVDGVWTIPTEEREKGNPKIIKLPQAVLDIIARQPRIAGNPFVFAARGRGPFNSFSQRKEELDDKLPKMKPWVLHDLRRTCRKLMSRAGVRADVGELALGHSIKGIQGIYDDPVEYRPLIEQALQHVANEVDKILHPRADNVVTMKQER